MSVIALIGQVSAGKFIVPAGCYIVSIFQDMPEDFVGGIKYGTAEGAADVVGENNIARLDAGTPVFSYKEDTAIYFDAIHGWPAPVDIRVVINSLVE